MTDWLLPGLTTQTHRARYYAFYVWSIHDTNERDAPEKRRDFVEGMRRREATFVLANLAHHAGNSPDNLVGVEQGKRQWVRGRPLRSFSTDFAPLPSDPLGGYGQYYGGSLYRLGLIHTPEDAHEVDQLTNQGISLAKAFERAIANTRYHRTRDRFDDDLPLKLLGDLGEHTCLCRIARAPHERKTLIDIFFGLVPGLPLDAVHRTQTLLLILDVVGSAPSLRLPAFRRLNDEFIEQALYFGHFELTRSLRSYQEPDSLRECRERWRLVFLHRHLAYALEHLLTTLLEVLARTPQGLQLSVFVESLDWKLAHDTVARLARQPRGTRLADWIASIAGRPEVPDTTSSRVFDRRTGLRSHTNEWDLAGVLAEAYETGKPLAERITISLLLLLTLYCRFGHYRGTSPHWGELVGLAGDDLWFESVAQRIDEHVARGGSVSVFLYDLLSSEIVRQHDRTLYQRGNLESPWLASSGDLLVWQRDYEPIWRSSKLDNGLRLLADLRLIAAGEAAPALTREGKTLLTKLL